MTIKEAIQALNSNYKLSIQVAKVVSVTSQYCTIDFEDGRPLLDQVRLKAVIDFNNNAFTIIPKVGSYVLVAPIMSDNSIQVIVAYSVVDKLSLQINNTKFIVDADGFYLARQGDNLRGVLCDLVDAINSITVPTGTGPSGTPINATTFQSIKTRIQKILKDA